MTDRLPTHDEVREWQRDTRSDVKTLHQRIEDVRAEYRDEDARHREELGKLRERVTRLEAFREWHDREWDQWTDRIAAVDATQREDSKRIWIRLTLLMALAASAGGGLATAIGRLL